MEDGSVKFTTSAIVTSDDARILRMNIRDFYPLVYHEHPGATQIVQRLGRVMVMQQAFSLFEFLLFISNLSEYN